MKNDDATLNSPLLARLPALLSPVEEKIEKIAHEYEGLLDGKFSDAIRIPGKRIRAAMVILFAKAIKGEDLSEPELERAACFAAGVELIHLASLVHDDVLDATVTRRGRKTLVSDFDNKIAILLGDILVAEALKMVNSCKKIEVVEEITSAARLLGLGEIKQMNSIGNLSLTQVQYEEIIFMKTAALFVLAAQMGVMSLDVFVPENLEFAKEFGISIGKAFQIIDDLLDYNGLGMDKARLTDFKERKVTLPIIYLMQKADELEKEEIKALFSVDGADDDGKSILALMEKCDIFTQVKDYARSLVEDTDYKLGALSNCKDLILLSQYCLQRLK